MAATFPQRKIGNTSVSALALGCMSFSIPTPTGLPNEDESLAVLTAAADIGITTFVTSDYYGPFHNENLLGRWFRETGRRDDIFLVTKFGPRIDNGKMTVNGHPEYVKEAFEKSLKRLGTDRVELYMSHRIDPKTPIEVTIQAMKELVQEGKVKYIGLSECSARTLQRAHAVHPIAAVEMEFSPFALDIEDSKTNLLATARELGVKVICYSPLGRGFLTGAIKSRDDIDTMRKIMPRFSEENFPDNMKIVDGFKKIAAEKRCTPSQIALAWVLAQGEDFIPLPGTKHIKFLRENAASVKVEITTEDEKKIRKVIEDVGGAKGARYPEAVLHMCFGDTPELSTK